MSTWQPLPDGDVKRIIVECRRSLSENAEHLPPGIRFRMLAIQRAMEATRDHTRGFTLEAVFEQVRKIAARIENIPDVVADVARRAKLEVNPASFFNSYVSGKKKDGKTKRFNSYVRDACVRLGLGYISVIGRYDDGGQIYFRLERARSEAGPHGPSLAESPEVETLKRLIRDGALLLANRGWGADEVGQVYQAAVMLADQLVASEGATMGTLRFEAGIGLWSHSLVIGKLEVARTEAARLLDLAQQNNDRSMRIVAFRASGTNAFWLGQFKDAESYLRRCLEELEGFAYQPFATDLGAPPFSLVSADLADTLWALGRYQESLATIQCACERAIESNQYFHYCYSLTFSTWIRFKLGEVEAAVEAAGQLQEQARRYGLAAFRALGKALQGIILASRSEDPSEGIGRMYEGIGAWQASGSELLVCYFFTEAARAWSRCGHVHAAKLELNKAFQLTERTGEGYYAAEMHRLLGEITWLWGKDYAEAETDLRTALDIASIQQALTFRLRAAMSLLRLSRARNDLRADRKRRQIAEQELLLRSALDAFAPEDDSADMQTARSLLAESAAPAPRRRKKGP